MNLRKMMFKGRNRYHVSFLLKVVEPYHSYKGSKPDFMGCDDMTYYEGEYSTYIQYKSVSRFMIGSSHDRYNFYSPLLKSYIEFNEMDWIIRQPDERGRVKVKFKLVSE
jgi:hypothetical protein